MRKILLLFTLLLSGFAVQAQLFGHHWENGAYYDKKGARHNGLVSEYLTPNNFSSYSKSFLYKKNKNSNSTELKYADIKSLAIYFEDGKIDSFIVSSRLAEEGKPLLLVILDNPVKLFASVKQRTAMAPVPMVSFVSWGYRYNSMKYYVGDSPNNVVEIDKKNFITMMSRVMEDKPEVVKRIENKDFKKGDMEELVYFYKTGVEKPSESSGAIDGKYY